ncbi:MAG: carboxypeptidase-like regulatory domain-containing protein [Gemmatimonadota bacterium]
MTRTTLRHAAAFLLLAGLADTLGTSVLGAQASTTGTMMGQLLDERGVPVPDAGLTLSHDGVVIRIARGQLSGRFSITGLVPGAYVLLAEQVGYQPVRLTAIPVSAGQATTIALRLERRPPPVSAPVERRYDGLGPSTAGRQFRDGSLEAFDRFRSASDVANNATGVIGGFEGANAFGLGANGMTPGYSQLVVDGLQESLLRHPGMPADAGSAPIFGRDGVGQIDIFGWSPSSSVPTTSGQTLSMISRYGSSTTLFRPWLSYSGASLGGAAVDNPADSSASSFRAGLALGGPIKGDTASWFLRFDYQQLQQPSAQPFETLDSDLVTAIIGAAEPTAVLGLVSPVVRTWTGFSGQAGVAYRIGRDLRFSGRLGMASWNEDAPSLATALTNGAGTRVESSDASGAVGVEYTNEVVTSTTTAGYNTSSRTWTSGSVPYTTLGSESVAFGAEPSLPGTFDESMIQLAQLFVLPFGKHELRAGGMVGRRAFTYDWLTDAAGHASYGSVDDFAGGLGSFVRSTSSSPADQIGLIEYSAFADGVFHLSPQLDAELGARFQVEKLPLDLTTPSLELIQAFGISNAVVPRSKSSSIGPRVALTFRPGTTGRTELRVGGGLVPGRWDRSVLAEVSRGHGEVSVSRGLGSVGWPTASGLTSADAFTLFGDGTKAPRTFVLDGMLRHALGEAMVVSVAGGYRHTDYLLRRGDLNRPAASLATSSDLRPIWGTLEQVGSLIAPTPGSNTRLREFDHVYALSSSGFSDSYEVRVGASRALGSGVEVLANYTWSKTHDNLVGARSADPADRLLPLDGAAAAPAWDEGRSDLDVPHRFAALLRWSPPGDNLSLGARFRMRSGLPFTAGFPLGTDVNGDGSSANDPVALSSVAGLGNLLDAAGCTPGSSAFALRNGCREATVQALDLQASVRLPISGGGVRLTVDAFNLAASATGRVDRAAVQIDPAGTITHDAQGRVVLPLVLNDNFGNLLVRRNDPRTIRIGLRVEK